MLKVQPLRTGGFSVIEHFDLGHWFFMGVMPLFILGVCGWYIMSFPLQAQFVCQAQGTCLYRTLHFPGIVQEQTLGHDSVARASVERVHRSKGGDFYRVTLHRGTGQTMELFSLDNMTDANGYVAHINQGLQGGGVNLFQDKMFQNGAISLALPGLSVLLVILGSCRTESYFEPEADRVRIKTLVLFGRFSSEKPYRMSDIVDVIVKVQRSRRSTSYALQLVFRGGKKADLHSLKTSNRSDREFDRKQILKYLAQHGVNVMSVVP